MKKLVVIAVLMTTIGAVAQTPAAPPPMTKPGMTLTTTAFDDGGIIPNKYTQAAENGAPVSPKLTWTNVPDGVVSFALILHDPDTSLNKTTEEVLHWMVFNIPGTARELPEGMPAQAQMAAPERAQIEQYIADLRGALTALRTETMATIIELASLPDMIRGFGPVKDAARAKAELRRVKLLGALNDPLPGAIAAE